MRYGGISKRFGFSDRLEWKEPMEKHPPDLVFGAVGWVGFPPKGETLGKMAKTAPKPKLVYLNVLILSMIWTNKVAI